MTSQLLEAPPITREDIVNEVLGYFRGKVESNNKRIASEREQLREPSCETDRDELVEHRRLALEVIASREVDRANSLAFVAWLERQNFDGNNPLAPGNIWVLQTEMERMIWIVYDPKDVRPGMEVYVTINDANLHQRLSVDQIVTLTVNCPLYERLEGKTFGEGAEIEIGVEGNDPEIIRLVRIL
jgi:hypothetical protein